jgi:hypothetical protein
LRRNSSLPSRTQGYFKRYRVIYRRVIKEAKTTQNGRYLYVVTRVMLPIINKEVVKSPQYEQKLN